MGSPAAKESAGWASLGSWLLADEGDDRVFPLPLGETCQENPLLGLFCVPTAVQYLFIYLARQTLLTAARVKIEDFYFKEPKLVYSIRKETRIWDCVG
jgi:hypothetical protein